MKKNIEYMVDYVYDDVCNVIFYGLMKKLFYLFDYVCEIFDIKLICIKKDVILKGR